MSLFLFAWDKRHGRSDGSRLISSILFPLSINGFDIPPLIWMTTTNIFLSRYITTQNNLIAFAKSRTEIHKVFEYIGNLCKNSLHIRLGLQTVYRGFNIPHAIILVLKDVENSPLTLTDVTQKIFDTIRQDHQEVVARIPLAGGVFKTTEYVVIGKMMNGDVQFKQSVTLEDLEGVLGEEGKLRIEWMHWNRGVKLVEKGGESDGGVDQKAVTRSEARDSVMMTLCER